MTQPAKAQEPSMEEILASIRRIIADDDTSKTAAEGRRAVPPPPVAVRPDRRRRRRRQRPAAAAATGARAGDAAGRDRRDAVEPQRGGRRRRRSRSRAGARYPRSDRIDGGGEPEPARTAASAPSTGSPTWCSTSGRSSRRPPPPPRRAPMRGRATRCSRRRRPRRSIPPSTRSRRPCWCRTPARSRIWCAKCCGRCSRPGSTTICRAWSSGWCAPRSSASRAGASSCRCRKPLIRRFAARIRSAPRRFSSRANHSAIAGSARPATINSGTAPARSNTSALAPTPTVCPR